MWTPFIIFTSLVTIIIGSQGVAGIQTYMSEGVKSIDHRMVYGDEDMTVINEVIDQAEKRNGIKKSITLSDTIKPLPAEDVKCIMSVDRYCSKEMGDVKRVLIQAIKEDCVKCTQKEKEKAGKVVASLMAHDHVAWKLFLTRTALLIKKQEEPTKTKGLTFKEIGEPEDVIRSPRNSYIMSGAKVRVKRYISKVVE